MTDISPNGVASVNPADAAKLLRDNGTLDRARKHMKFGEPMNTDVASLPGKWRKNAKTGTFTNGSGEAFREALSDCADELDAALATPADACMDGLDTVWLNRLLLRVCTETSNVEISSKCREQAAILRTRRRAGCSPAPSAGVGSDAMVTVLRALLGNMQIAGPQFAEEQAALTAAIDALQHPAAPSVDGGEIARLQGVIERDRTVFCGLIVRCKNVLKGRKHLGDENARAASGYAYDEPGFIREFGEAWTEIMGELERMHRVFQDFTDSPRGDAIRPAQAEAEGILSAAPSVSPAVQSPLMVTRGDGVPLPDQAAAVAEFKRQCLRSPAVEGGYLPKESECTQEAAEYFYAQGLAAGRLATPEQPGSKINPAWSLEDRVEFALRDAGFDYDEAFRIAKLAGSAVQGEK